MRDVRQENLVLLLLPRRVPLPLLPLLVLGGSRRLMGYIRNRLLEDAKEDGRGK